MSLADAVATAPRRRISGRFWHQGPTRHPLTSCADPARGPGRYHRTGDPGVWYASSQEQAAWAELFRHFSDDGVDPFELRRRVGRVCVTLEALDLTDEAVRTHLGVHESDLVGDDYSATQAIAAAARDAGHVAVPTIVTDNVRDSPAELLEPFGVEAVTADAGCFTNSSSSATGPRGRSGATCDEEARVPGVVLLGTMLVGPRAGRWCLPIRR